MRVSEELGGIWEKEKQTLVLEKTGERMKKGEVGNGSGDTVVLRG